MSHSFCVKQANSNKSKQEQLFKNEPSSSSHGFSQIWIFVEEIFIMKPQIALQYVSPCYTSVSMKQNNKQISLVICNIAIFSVLLN